MILLWRRRGFKSVLVKPSPFDCDQRSLTREDTKQGLDMRCILIIVVLLVGAMTLTGCASTRCTDVHGNQKNLLFEHCSIE